MDKVFETAIIVVGVVVFVLGISALFAWPVQLLWNGCLVYAVTWAKPIDFLTAWGISILCGILVKPTTTSK